MLSAGVAAPSFTLPEVGGDEITDPWADGPVVLAFFKTSCPVCRLSAPMVQAIADSGVRVVAIGEDPPDALRAFASDERLTVTTLSEDAPFDVSEAFGLATVPSLFLVDDTGTIRDTVVSWDRDEWNHFAAAAGGTEVSREGDGRPPVRPG
jgi:peroxiredoxin